MKWYALFVKTGKEDLVVKYLSYHFNRLECLPIIPKTRIIERTKGKYYEVLKPLFPGYVLINSNMNYELYNKIKMIPIVYNLLGQAEEYYTSIYNEEMEPILKLINKDNIIDYSKVYIDNSMVYVKAGPLKGMEGTIKHINKRKKRATIALDFMGSYKMINVGIEILAKIE